jgi:hypothetical protein
MKLNWRKFQAGKVGRPKYHVSKTNVAMSVVGPIIAACKMKLRETVWGRRRRKVIIEVGRNTTARAANNDARDSDLD